LTPAPTAVPMVIVHVSGEVLRPGIVEVPVGARAYEAIDAAGGALAAADLDQVNLASPVIDGQQLRVPPRAEEPGGPSPPSSAPAE
jgi:competence protein ComEA